ncbi:MAG: Crp/Fnr family transcriptional regulator [Agriterribacter sp.]
MNIKGVIKKINDDYGPLSRPCRQDLLAHMEVVELSKKEILLKQGEQAPTLYFVVSGGLKGYYIREDIEVVDTVAVENEFVGSFDSFFFGNPSHQYFQAFEPTILVVMARSKMNILEEQYWEITLLLDKVIKKYLVDYKLKINSLQFEAGKERYKNLAATRPDIIDRLPLKDIASYIGVTFETLSRIRKHYKT